MEARKLYDQLEKDFITSEMSDEWFQYMDSVKDFVCDNFKERSMGLVCDFTTEIEKVYTAVFPSDEVMQKILDDGVENAMLFVHHPAIWDLTKAPEIFQQMNRELLQKFKERKISIYNLHVPLDNYGEYSTNVTLADALNVKIKKPFAFYRGGLAGILGKVDCENIKCLKDNLESAVDHEVKLYQYGEANIKGEMIAVVAGGGNDMSVLKEMVENNVKNLVTGVTVKNDFSKESHEFAEKNKINILGGTHYSTEKFACIEMVDYFKNLGLDSEFIKNEPMMEDL